MNISNAPPGLLMMGLPPNPPNLPGFNPPGPPTGISPPQGPPFGNPGPPGPPFGNQGPPGLPFGTQGPPGLPKPPLGVPGVPNSLNPSNMGFSGLPSQVPNLPGIPNNLLPSIPANNPINLSSNPVPAVPQMGGGYVPGVPNPPNNLNLPGIPQNIPGLPSSIPAPFNVTNPPFSSNPPGLPSQIPPVQPFSPPLNIPNQFAPNLPKIGAPGVQNFPPPAPNFNNFGMPPPIGLNQGQPIPVPMNISPAVAPGFVPNPISSQSISISVHGSSVSGSPYQSVSYNIQKNVNCPNSTGGIINSHNLQRDIANKYGGNIQFQGNRFVVSGSNQSTVDQMTDELQELIKKFTFDDNAKWAYLENDGSYRHYDQIAGKTIENRYRACYPELISSNYENYSLRVEFNITGSSYFVEFAKIGGVHRQKRKNVDTSMDTIRAVKRQGSGEDLNKNFVRNYSWLWQHEDGGFRVYEPDAIFLIEQSHIEFKTGKTKEAIVLIQGCNGKTYKLDFSTMAQFNEMTNFRRPIRRDII